MGLPVFASSGQKMSKMKIKIEIEDKGMKSTHEFEGAINREKIINFLDAAGVFMDASDDLQEDASPR